MAHMLVLFYEETEEATPAPGAGAYQADEGYYQGDDPDYQGGED